MKKYNVAEPLEDDPLKVLFSLFLVFSLRKCRPSCANQTLPFVFLKAMIWEYLGLTRVYTKRKGQPPDLQEPVVLSAIRELRLDVDHFSFSFLVRC